MAINRDVAAGWASRLIALALGLANTRLILEIVHVDGFAAQAIVASLAPWIALLNLGLPASTQNLIGQWRAQGKNLSVLRNTAGSLAVVCFVVLLPVALVVAAVTREYLLAAYPFVHLWSVMAACVLLSATAIGSTFYSMLHAEHRSFWPNIYPGLIAVMQFLCLLALWANAASNFNVVLALLFLPGAAVAGLAMKQLGVSCLWPLDKDCVRSLWIGAREFLLIGLLGTATLSVDYIIISRLLPPAEIAAYNLTGRIFMLILSIHAVVLASAWTPIGDLFVSRSYQSARRSTADAFD